ncbi:7842_t:CDS:2 [Funneliformis geosporum]|uniref:7842_t:CDS:1 n=1 Tax=Funneliformis geosporum TaxID=1117311 RepID=A0A9W4STD4_9GLOM|nr:7842_t:CDS:2 [Funneliformis geosporum]
MKEVSGSHRNRVKFWKVNVDEKRIEDDNISTEDDIMQKLSGKVMKDQALFSSCFKDELANHNNITVENMHIITVISTSTEEPLMIKRIIETGWTIGNKDKPVITMYKYIERTHIQEFIQNRIEINLCAFERGSSRQNDYQGISISSGSGTGKMRHGFETINIIKDLKQIKDSNFEVIHIFVQIFLESSLVHFDKCLLRDQSTGRYPHDLSHVNNVSIYLALAIASYYFTKNYQQESLQYFKELAKSSAFDLITRDEYLIANILRYTSQLVANKQVCDLGILIVPICTGTAPVKLQEFDNPGHLSVTDYNVYNIHMSLMDIERSLNFMDSVIDHKMRNSNEITSPISRENLLYLILIGAIKGIAIIMEECALELLKMKSPLDSAEQAREIWKILVEWAKKRYSLTNWLDSVGGRKDPQDKEDEKRKRAILKFMFWIHTQKSITKDTALDESTVRDHEAEGLIFLEEIDNTQYKAKVPLVLIASLVSHLGLGFFDDIILDPFNQLDEESFPKFILHMHLITYRLADMIRVRQMTIKEIYFGCLQASGEVLSMIIAIQHNVDYRSAPILKKKDHNDAKNPYSWNQLNDRKKVSIIADAKNDKVEIIDVTIGRFIVLVCRHSGSSDSLTPHAEEQYKFSSAIESDFPVHETLTGEFTLEDFKKELEKATPALESYWQYSRKRLKKAEDSEEIPNLEPSAKECKFNIQYVTHPTFKK